MEIFQPSLLSPKAEASSFPHHPLRLCFHGRLGSSNSFPRLRGTFLLPCIDSRALEEIEIQFKSSDESRCILLVLFETRYIFVYLFSIHQGSENVSFVTFLALLCYFSLKFPS